MCLLAEYLIGFFTVWCRVSDRTVSQCACMLTEYLIGCFIMSLCTVVLIVCFTVCPAVYRISDSMFHSMPVYRISDTVFYNVPVYSF